MRLRIHQMVLIQKSILQRSTLLYFDHLYRTLQRTKDFVMVNTGTVMTKSGQVILFTCETYNMIIS